MLIAPPHSRVLPSVPQRQLLAIGAGRQSRSAERKLQIDNQASPVVRAQHRSIKARAQDSSSRGDGDPNISSAERHSMVDDTSDSVWKRGWQLVMRTATLVWASAWTIVAVFALSDATVFLVHRLCHRITNEVAIRFLLPSHLGSAEAVGGSLWWLSNNPEIANFQTGYQWVVGLVFLLMFPLGILLRTFATATAQLVLGDNMEKTGHPGWRPPIKRVAGDLRLFVPKAKAVLLRLWQVDLLVAVRAIPLQGLSLFLIPVPWTLPRILNLQLASPVSLFDGEHGDDALKKSAQLVEPIRKVLAGPYVGLLLTPKLLAFLGRFFLTSLSPRIAKDVPEIPILAYLLLALATVVLNRIQDLLPLVAYVEAHQARGRQPRLEVAA